MNIFSINVNQRRSMMLTKYVYLLGTLIICLVICYKFYFSDNHLYLLYIWKKLFYAKLAFISVNYYSLKKWIIFSFCKYWPFQFIDNMCNECGIKTKHTQFLRSLELWQNSILITVIWIFKQNSSVCKQNTLQVISNFTLIFMCLKSSIQHYFLRYFGSNNGIPECFFGSNHPDYNHINFANIHMSMLFIKPYVELYSPFKLLV